MALQQNIIQKFMRTLNYTVNSNTTQLLDTAVVSCQGNYTTIQQVINDCVEKCSSSSSYDEFLKKYCGIDLDNEDTGALVGFDASGYAVESAESIIPEGDISEWAMPDTTTVKYGTLEVNYPSFTGLTTEQQFIIGALHTWWIPRALHLIAMSFGYEFNNIDATPKVLGVEFTTEAVGLLAHVDCLFNVATGKTVQLDLKVNMTMYNTILTTDPNGTTSAYGTTIPYLDRTIAHEFVHAVEAANIDYFGALANDHKWFTEGSAELVHGIDDKRRTNIIDITSNPSRFASAFTSSPVSAEDVYSAGYILLRFFAKQVAKFYNVEYTPKRHLMVERGNVKTLKELGEKFIAFAQRSNNMVQSWELLDDRLSSFYGATLRVPMKRWHDSASKDKYFLYTSTILHKHGSSTYDNFIDMLKSKYPLATVLDDYSISGLDTVNTMVSDGILDDKSHVMFSGCELSLASGDSPYTVLTKLKNIINTINGVGARPTLFITPIEDVYSGGSITDAYRQLLRNSYISRKINMVCLGDSITDYTGGWSWTTYCQEKLPNAYIINKGVGGNQTSHAVARFTTDVIEQMPDLCFMLIGGNDMWNAGTTEMATAKTNWKQMVDDCIANNITPVIGLYTPTLEQIEQFVSGWASGTYKDPAQILMNFNEFYQYCSEIAKSYKLMTIDAYHDLKNLDGSINLEDVVPDKVHLSLQGAEKMGYYIADKLKEFIWDKQTQLHQDYDIVNIYDIFCENLGVDELSQTDLESLMCDAKIHYKDGDALDYITNYIYGNELLVPFNCPYFYVSLEHMNVTSQTYPNWLRTGHMLENHEEYSAHSKDDNDEYSDWQTKVYYQSEKYDHSINRPSVVRHVFGKYGGTDRENAFKNTGEFVAIGLHTLFDKDIWMCEQGGITCNKEAMAQINDLNLLPWRSSMSPRTAGSRTYEGAEVKLPVFPGTGCPWFTVSDDNKATFEVSINGIDYWFTKSDYDATITIRFSNKGKDYDVYQSISLGMMTNVTCESYMFPLYVAGGNQALSQDIYVYTAINAIYPTYKKGNIYDLDIQNICLSNSNLLHPTKFNNANMSNFRILSPEGEWKDIYGHSQVATVKPYPTCADRIYNWGIILEDVVHGMSGSYHSALPFMSDVRNKIDMYTVDRRLNQYEHTSVLDRVIVNLKKELPHLATGVEGVIPNCYQSWYRTMPAGEVEINGKKYLSVPNGWEKRLWNYPWFLGMYSDEQYWKNERIRKKYDDLHNELLQNMMVDRLIIPLEEEGE